MKSVGLVVYNFVGYPTISYELIGVFVMMGRCTRQYQMAISTASTATPPVVAQIAMAMSVPTAAVVLVGFGVGFAVGSVETTVGDGDGTEVEVVVGGGVITHCVYTRTSSSERDEA